MHGAWRVDQDVPNPQELGSEFPASAPCPPPFSLQSQLSQEVILPLRNSSCPHHLGLSSPAGSCLAPPGLYRLWGDSR